jgi:hypothetical protein
MSKFVAWVLFLSTTVAFVAVLRTQLMLASFEEAGDEVSAAPQIEVASLDAE